MTNANEGSGIQSEPGTEDMSGSGVERTKARVATDAAADEALPEPDPGVVTPEVKEHYKALTEMGAMIEGEGQILAVKHDEAK